MTTTIRVSRNTRDTLHQLARDAGVPIQTIIDQALEQYRRQHMLNTANAAYAALRADPQAWQEAEAEQEVWDDTLNDGLENV